MPSASLPYNPTQRIAVLMLGVLVLFAIIAGRLVNLQVFKHSYFVAVAENQRKRAAELQPHRGAIYVSEGTDHEPFPVASNNQAWIAYAVPRDMPDPMAVSRELAPALYQFHERQQGKTRDIIEATGQNIPPTLSASAAPQATPQATPTPLPAEDAIRQLESQLFTKFNQKTDPYEPLLKPYEVLDTDFLTFLQDKKLPGIVLEDQERRFYPEGQLAAHLLGYVGFDSEKRIGRYGVEGFFNDTLEGDLGWLSGERDIKGSIIGVGKNEFKPAQDGADVYLTVDRVVQSFIEQELERGVKKYGAERGSVIVMNPKTGAILGMATYPTFDPNTYYAVKDARVQTNPVVSDIFEPGSILKPIIMATAMEEELIKPNTTFADSGPVKVDKYTINTFDGKHHGIQTMTQVLEQSNNIGMVWVGQQLGAQRMYDYLRRFGLGERTGIELDGETQTNLPQPQKWNIATVATASFGQGVAMTPLQALNSINAIANRGQLTQPHIISSIASSDGQKKTTHPVVTRQVVRPEVADKVSAMMVSVVENGVGGLARVPGYYMAGKTGTAQVPDERGKYSADRKIISFVGFGPVEDPKFSIMIKLDNPAGLSFASGTAAPMFRNIATKPPKFFVTD
ncbi:MAG: penicillin-binding protein 2 [Candidatus Sungbacteria bacterium]|nr:penicillin-binding protein 2 [Candidatus Sungbacteria bacterium]